SDLKAPQLQDLTCLIDLEEIALQNPGRLHLLRLFRPQFFAARPGGLPCFRDPSLWGREFYSRPSRWLLTRPRFGHWRLGPLPPVRRNFSYHLGSRYALGSKACILFR